MNALAEFRISARRQPLTHLDGGALAVSGDNSAQYRLSAGPTLANTEDNKTIFAAPTLPYTSATDQRELFIGQCYRVLRFVLFGTMFYLDRLHVVHLERITDRFVRKHSLSDPGGGAVKKYLTLAL